MRAGKPKNINDYRVQIINRVNIYSPLDFLSPYPLTINIQGCFGINVLTVSGWKLI